ncbi:WbqC family protein [Carboxylicivirga sp. A043]|nr:WbqC family protein [Carboxylicivirga sp. A043]
MKQMFQNKIIPLTYLGPIHVFAYVVNSSKITIEQYANYQRKTYSNRCSITGANGPLSLAVPVVNVKNEKVSLKDTQISYDTDWQKQHWRSIVSAYNSSPFFEYYADDFAPFYEKEFKYLVDFNMGLFQVILEELELEIDIQLTDEYIRPDVLNDDIRRLIHPKAKPEEDKLYKQLEYRQVFSDKYPFIPNLSVIDLLFSKGPETYDILKDSILF